MRAAREADATFARQQAERAKKLLDAGAMSQQEYDQAAAQQKAAEAQLKAVDEQIRQQQRRARLLPRHRADGRRRRRRPGARRAIA